MRLLGCRSARPPLAALVVLVGCEPSEPLDSGPDIWRGDQEVAGLADLALRVAPVGADGLNPHGDGSGRVLLSASAAEAETYTFSVDGGAGVVSASGEVEVEVGREGTVDYEFAVTAVGASGATASVRQSARVYRSTSAFPRLVWADEFDVDGPVDPARWKAQVIPPNNGGWFNGEQQHYTARPENVYVSGGTLKIVARRERYTVDGSTKDFTSARLNGTFPFTYGRVEVRARLPEEAGTWPAIWTLGANVNEIGNPFGTTLGDVGWPACGEIDILEQRGWDKQTTIAHFHWGDTRTGAYANEGGELRVPAATTEFHVYGLYWDERVLEVRVDDRVVYAMPNDEGRPYDNPHYLLLNIAMGGNLGGDIPRGFDAATLEVDWVRVYQ